MPKISEEDVAGVLAKGNGASTLIPQSGGRFLKLSYLWGKLRIDRCDEKGKLLPPDRRGKGGDTPATPSS